MGIPYYFYAISKKYPGILLQQLPEHLTCQHLLFDYNGIIHTSSYTYLSTLQKTPKDIEKNILQEVWKSTVEIIDRLSPEKSVQIYIDGVAPVAKMNQQRRRRFLSIYQKKLAGTVSLWDSNAISPGTTFMTRLHASLKAHIRLNKKSFEYYLSSSDEPGEGEHKMFKRLRSPYFSENDVKIIYGMDADLIMLSLISNTKHIYLYRENQWLLNIDKLRQGILEELKYQYHFEFDDSVIKEPNSEKAQEIIESYIVLCFILGNDFLPHPIHIDLKQGGLEDILIRAATIWNATKLPVVDYKTSTIQWHFLIQLLDGLSMHETDHVYDKVHEYKIKRPRGDDPVDQYPLIHKDPFIDELLFKIDKQKWRMYYYKYLFNTSMNDTSIIKQSCDLYLKGILWTYQYYKQLPKDPYWYFPYAYAPTLKDLSNHLNIHITEYERLKENWQEQFPKDVFVSPIIQLLSILPEESITCLPIKYHSIIQDKFLHYLFPKEYPLNTFMKHHLWECTPKLPPMNINYLHQILTSDPKLSS